MKFIILILKYYLKFIYVFIKFFSKKKKQVFFISRQTNDLSINYQELINYIKKQDNDILVKISCKRVSEGLNKVIHLKNNKFSYFLKSILSELLDCIKYFFLLHKQMYFIATSKVVITDGYNILISCLNHKKNTCIIQMWHALAAIKKFGYQSIGNSDGMSLKTAKLLQMHNNYDYILSGSEEMRKPFSEAFNADISKILSIGTPYIDYLLNIKTTKKQLQKKYKFINKKPIVLYSPTFRKDGRSAVNDVISAVDTSKYNLIVTLHPLDAKNVNPNIAENVVINPNIEYPQLLKIADYVITDYSALMIEAAILKTNILLYVYDYDKYKKENGLNINLFSELPGCVSKNINDLVNIINNDNYDKQILLDFRKKYITNLSNDSTKKIYELIKNNL